LLILSYNKSTKNKNKMNRIIDKNYMSKKCIVCQKEFQGVSSKKYCSDLCKYGVKKCSGCGKEIIRKTKNNNTNGNYCSTSCFYKDRNVKELTFDYTNKNINRIFTILLIFYLEKPRIP
jgi:DNA-directed RNA polymerase subunit RPC12/RpoP